MTRIDMGLDSNGKLVAADLEELLATHLLVQRNLYAVNHTCH